jgi:type III secretory pathway component EscU
LRAIAVVAVVVVVVVVVVAVALVLAGTARLSKSFEVSTRVMKAMNNMVSMRTVSDTMKELEKEMLKVRVLLAVFCFFLYCVLFNQKARRLLV